MLKKFENNKLQDKEMNRTSEFTLGNKAMREKRYEEALAHYDQARKKCPALIDYIDFNINLISFRLENRLEKPKNLDSHSFELIISSGLFDSRWYLEKYQDEYCISNNPLFHYLECGAQKGLNPSKYFNTNYYLKNNPDVALTEVNPLIHYVTQGIEEGRKPLATEFCTSEIKYEKKLPYIGKSPLVKVLAFYLPQFHPISENDKWWEEGFTEWTNVTKAVPLFEGHHQPQLPDAMGFYDLRLPEVLSKQAKMAREFGIHGFCFHHYYFAGKRLLETPVDNLITHPEIDINFCLCWANENWTRRWDGADNEILIAQNHTPEDDIRFIEDIDKYLSDSRYITVDNKPVLIIYRAGIFPDMKATIKRWRKHRKLQNKSDLFLVMAITFGDFDPIKYGFDAAVEFPPHPAVKDNEVSKLPEVGIDISSKQIEGKHPNFSGCAYDYKSITQCYPIQNVQYPLFKTSFPAWDNTARRGSKSHIYVNDTPAEYCSWTYRNICYSYDKLPESCRFTFINAWNEWAEGAHLEPDQKFGYGYLNATAKALMNAEDYIPSHESKVVTYNADGIYLKKKILIVIHIYYIDMVEKVLDYLKKIPCNFDICISTISTAAKKTFEVFDSAFPQSKVIVKVPENVGFDIAPFIIEFKDEILKYPYVCKIHTKKSVHNTDLSSWCHYLYSNLLGSKYIINNILQYFLDHPKTGIIFPECYQPAKKFIGWGENGNIDIAKGLFERLNIFNELPSQIEFPSGSMFWFRPEAMLKLFECNLTYEDFLPSSEIALFADNKPIDGTLAHAIERILAELVKAHGFEYAIFKRDVPTNSHQQKYELNTYD